MTDSERVAHEVAAPLADRIEALRELVPEAFGEDGVDFDKLRAALGDELDDRPERYSFTWAGKRDAIRLLQAPSRATLVPARDESVDFDTTQHVFIEGENLETLKLLYKAYAGRVKMIYIDPPYNTGNDFIYPDNFSRPAGHATCSSPARTTRTATSSPATPRPAAATTPPGSSMMYPRLFLARQLLRDDGVIFVSIDDHEVHNLRLAHERDLRGGELRRGVHLAEAVLAGQPAAVGAVHDYVLLYARQAGAVR